MSQPSQRMHSISIGHQLTVGLRYANPTYPTGDALSVSLDDLTK